MTFGHEIYPGQIIIKDIEILQGLFERNFAPLLVSIILSIAKDYGIIITESYRVKKHINDLHGTQPIRAIDLRSWAYPGKTAYKVSNNINHTWEYDRARPEKLCCLIHETNRGGIHMHIQVSPATRRRGV